MKELSVSQIQKRRVVFRDDISLLQHSPYNPYTKEQWAKIKSDWVSYKQDIGLEVDLYLQLTGEGKSDGDALKLVEERRKEVEKTREAWYDLRR